MNNTAIRYGLILAAIGIVSQLAIYMVNVELMASMSSGLIMLVISIVLIIYFARLLRQSRGGFATFREMFGDIFTMLMISALVGAIFNYILFNFIDPELATTIKNLTIKNSEAMFVKLGMSAEQIDLALAEIEKQDMSMTIGKSVQQLAVSGIVYAIISAILAAILKKNKPEEVF
ncbi:DUF4199 domain-containing protein [Rhodoflexus caldus]|uniref:DUF4199 domain-containing protein n=1 Tax=Rhodoflexus caldus TaxID=2891236 RepID=UPI002029FB1F|nr:DUF4199 domain-containing protein [Rhodoflexus caldus]